MSQPEMRLWMRLRSREPDQPLFRRQHVIGPFIVDFYCAKAFLAVEVDGISHGMGDRPERDARRDAYLESRGIRVYRIAARTVLEDPDWVAHGLIAVAREIIATRSSTA